MDVSSVSVLPVNVSPEAVKTRPPIVSGAESVIVPAVPPKNAVSALVKFATTDESVPAVDVDQFAVVVSQAPVPPTPPVTPLVSQ